MNKQKLLNRLNIGINNFIQNALDSVINRKNIANLVTGKANTFPYLYNLSSKKVCVINT